MRISEIFYSIQGEGLLAGVPSVFVRTTGCNLRCTWCDTPYASWQPRGNETSIDDILAQVARHPSRHVVITGGEPMLLPAITPLTRRLREAGCHVTIETAATIHRPVDCDLASLSPKLANSTPSAADHPTWAARHERDRLNLDVIRRFMADGAYQLKFVIDDPADLCELEDLLAAIGQVPPANVLLMPQGIDAGALAAKSRWLAEQCKSRGFRYCPRLHIDLYGNTPGT